MAIPQAVPYVILAVTLVVGLVLNIAGCATSKYWYPLFILIPGGLALLCQYGLSSSDPEKGYEGGWISFDTWVFLLAVCLISCIGLPLVFYHTGFLQKTGLGLTLSGSIVIIGGYCAFKAVEKCASSDGY